MTSMSLRDEIRHTLRAHGIRLTKVLGQHFLADEGTYDAIVDLAALRPEERVLEIGAGLGHLTERLAARGGHVTAVEMDPRCQAALRARLGDDPRVTLLDADIRRLSFPDLCQSPPWIVVANLPYYLSSLLLRRFVDHRGCFSRLILMLQREVAERLVAPPGPKSYGVLSVLVQAVADVELVRLVPRAAFLPPPDVESAVVRLLMRPPPLPDAAMPRFFEIVKRAFSQRRKTLRNNLRGYLALSDGEWETMAERAGIDLGRRGETLSVEEFARLTRALCERGEPGAPRGRGGVASATGRRRTR